MRILRQIFLVCSKKHAAVFSFYLVESYKRQQHHQAGQLPQGVIDAWRVTLRKIFQTESFKTEMSSQRLSLLDFLIILNLELKWKHHQTIEHVESNSFFLNNMQKC